ncbi:hypothetical protein [Couchioplanes caeruleus]|uniref:Uncharacterized protein n=1 Tax=Couchioplanes caeruleus TaxID=56438 RepID=A0A3N1GH12_9ACTN|nr:hypothetical protein [Couchioplanes caeruleus]ROP29524.1 hypothetical protein EDD30_2322 [Couchioplanes caeruleus]
MAARTPARDTGCRAGRTTRDELQTRLDRNEQARAELHQAAAERLRRRYR